MPVTFGGLFSGLDTNSLIDQLVAAERLPARIPEQKKDDGARRISLLGDLASRLKALGTEAGKLDTASELATVAASSSVAAQVGVTITGAPPTQSVSLRVDGLAAAQTSASRVLATDAAGVLGAGSVSISVAGAAAVEVTYGASDSLADLAERIRDQVTGVNASVVNDGTGFRLLVKGKSTGAANAVTFADTGDGLAFTEVVAAKDARFTLDGLPMTRGTNQLSDVVPGLRIDLTGTTAATDPDVVVSVATDGKALEAKVQSFVDSYNQVNKFLNEQLGGGAAGVNKGTDTLRGESSLQFLQRNLGAMVAKGRTHGAVTVSLGNVGISINRDGSLALDTTKLSQALDSDPSALSDLFIGQNDALGAEVAAAVTQYTQSTTGVLTARQEGIRKANDGYDDQIQRIQDNALAVGERLRKQFAALERIISNLQAQQSSLSSILTQ